MDFYEDHKGPYRKSSVKIGKISYAFIHNKQTWQSVRQNWSSKEEVVLVEEIWKRDGISYGK